MSSPSPDEQELPLDVEVTPGAGRRHRGEKRWDELHQRVTFHCPRELVRAIAIEAARSHRSKSQVIVDALTEHLQQGG